MGGTIWFVQRLFLFGSLAGLLLGAVMLCIPPDLYTTVRESDDEWIARGAWVLLMGFSLLGLLVTAVLFTIKRPEDDKGPLIIQR